MWPIHAAIAYCAPRRENLALLRYRPNIAAAAICTASGRISATYLQDDAKRARFPGRPQSGGDSIEGNYLMLARPIRDNDGVIGAVYLRARYEILHRMIGYGGIPGVVMAFSLLVAAFMSSRLEAASSSAGWCRWFTS